MRIITTGSRNWPEDWMGDQIIRVTMQGLWNANSYSNSPLTIVHGACPTGADKLVDAWVTRMEEAWANAMYDEKPAIAPGTRVHVERYPADWDAAAKAGNAKAAGPIRNTHMAKLGADLCVAFLYETPDKRSRGTWDMIQTAWDNGIAVVQVEFPRDGVRV